MTASVAGGAGALSITNWNNIANTTFTSGTIHSSDGQATVTLTLSGSGGASGWNNASTVDGSNGSLMKGYDDAGSNLGAVTNRISGLTGSSYSVFIYVDGDVSRRSAAGDMLPNYTVNGTRYYAAALGGAFAGFVRGSPTANNTSQYPPSLTYGNFLEIGNVVPAAGVITVSASSDTTTFRSPLNGLEIVASAGPPVIMVQPQAQAIYVGGAAQFTAAVWGLSPVYNWRKNGVALGDGGNILGSKTNGLTLTNLTLADTGDYDVVVTNNYGSVTSAVAHLDVRVATIADLAIDAFNAAFLANSGGKTYYRSSLTNSSDDGTWTLAIDIEGEEDAYERTGDPQPKKLVNDLCTSFIVINPGNWSWDGWNDDIGWNSLVLIRGYQMTGTASLLTAAANGYNFAFGRGWDTNFNGGGIWEQQPENMPTNQPPGKNPLACDSLGQVACMLYQSTSNATYLMQAQLIYGWVRNTIYTKAFCRSANGGAHYLNPGRNSTCDRLAIFVRGHIYFAAAAGLR